MLVPKPGTVVLEAMLLIVAICGSILASQGNLPILNAVLNWVYPILYFFMSECLYSGGCSWIVWVLVLLSALHAAGYLIGAAFPSKAPQIEDKLGGAKILTW